jgi:hypothetical protein
MTKTKPVIDVTEFELGGMTCYRWFNPEGTLCVDGPPEAIGLLRQYVGKYRPICEHSSFISWVAAIPPFGPRDLARKKRAMLTILVEHENEIKQGMGISAELVQTVLDTSEPLYLIK